MPGIVISSSVCRGAPDGARVLPSNLVERQKVANECEGIMRLKGAERFPRVQGITQNQRGLRTQEAPRLGAKGTRERQLGRYGVEYYK